MKEINNEKNKVNNEKYQNNMKIKLFHENYLMVYPYQNKRNDGKKLKHSAKGNNKRSSKLIQCHFNNAIKVYINC